MRITRTLLGAILLLNVLGNSGELPPSRSLDPVAATILYTAAKEYRPLAWLYGGERFPSGATVMLKGDSGVRKLVPQFAESADANVSFNAKQVLFAGKPKSSDHWQLWELSLESGKLQRITTGSDDAIRPMYLPEDRVAYAQKQGGRFVLEVVSLNGGAPVSLYRAPGSAMPTDVLEDGRILFDAAFPLGSSGRPEIYAIYSDGSGIESYRCDHGTARYSGKQLASGDIVFTHGPTLARFTSPLANEVSIQSPTGEYGGDVLENASGKWIFPFRARPKNVFSLVLWIQGEGRMATIIDEQGVNILQPALVAARREPNRHPSGLHEWKTANLLALNSHVSREKSIDMDIASVRLYTTDDRNKPVVIGTAAVEKDGSFFVRVPGDRPLKFELLDAAGRTIRHEGGWMWARSGEQRICVGCHAGPEHAPENAVPQVLLRSTTPVDLTGAPHVIAKRGN